MLRRTRISLADITKRYGDNLVLDRVSFTVKPGEKIGVIGDNGSGKSTLLRLMAGVEDPDNGELDVDSPDGVGYLPQRLELPDDRTVADAVDLALADLRRIEAGMRTAERAIAAGDDAAAPTYDDLVARFESRGGWEADLRVEQACAALGLPALDHSRPIGTLSGGERSRLALAGTLAARPALLLLDEPSNDLDDEAVAWLEAQLRDWPGTVAAATHDRAFLDAVTTTMIEVADRRITRYGNGYSGYLAAKALERRQAAAAYEHWKAEVERQEGIVEANAGRMAAIPRKLPMASMSTGAFRTRSRTHGASGRIKVAKRALERLHAEAVPRPPEPMRFTTDITTTGAEGPRPAVVLRAVTVADRLDLHELVVETGERVLITGPNGAGKTSLLRVIAGEIEPDSGAVERDGAVGHLRQIADPAPDHRSVLRAFADGRVGTLEEHADALLRLGLFDPDRFGTPVSALSVGQRRRLELARLVTRPVDVLLLDEPTNHLSPVLAEELQEALDSYTGTVVLVSHDRRLRESFHGRRLAMATGTIATQARSGPRPPDAPA